ncbi:TonB-dependent receptor [Sphingomonas parva]|uniref:TonB-dependent receptor n=2 Tax=Sphingomonas parva TaxID=2555898 RepID=A0A4Y8ZQV0_9SPHN|nr:TonB-dependent receptor [Sphingomonas parva]
MAQTAGTIRGEHGQPGETVTVTDTVTGRSVTATVNEDGTFVVVGLRPSTYRVEGSGLAEDVTVPVGQIVTIDAAPAAEVSPDTGGEIIVQGRRDRTEVRTATVTTNVSQAQIENLPQNDRNFLNFAALAPGVSVSPSGGDKRVQAGAVSGDQVNVFIDGLSLKNPVNHGGVAGQNFSQGNPFPQLAVQEFKVDTQNFKAEYEQAGSAIITAVTKTGGTEFHGDVFGQFQPKSFIGRPFFDRPGNANNLDGSKLKPDYKRWQFGGDLGGPIIPEKLHFFVAYEGTRQKDPSTSVNLGRGVAASISNEFNGSFPVSFNQDLYFGKLSLFATPDDTIDASAFIRKEQNLRDFGGIAVSTHGHDITSNGELYQLEWDHRGDNWLNELTLAYNTFSNGTPRISDGPEIVLTCVEPTAAEAAAGAICGPRNDINARSAELGAHPFVQNDRQETWTIKNNATFDRGDHIIKAGGRVTFNKYSRLEDFRSNATYFFRADQYTGFETSTPYEAAISTISVEAATAKNTQFGLFIQDDWTPNDHWTVNAGIRWDYETNAKNENFVTPANIVNALRAYPGWQAAGINPDDYISTGKNRKPYWKAFQPRLGVAYDVYGDRDLILFAGAGRYYDRPLFLTAGIETIKALYQSVSTVQAAPGQPIPKDVEALRAAAIAQGLRGDVWLLNNDTKLPYSDQFNVGVRKRFGQWNTSLTLSHIRSHNIFQYVRGNRNPDGSYPTTSATGEFIIQDNFPTAGDLPGFDGKLNIGANEGESRYWGVFVQADKPYTRQSGWGVTSTFTWQRPRTNVGTELYADEFFAGPDQNQFGWNYSQGVEKYRFVGTGIVGLPLDFTLSGTLTLTSGPSFGSVIFYPDGGVFNGSGVYFPEKTFAYKSLDLRLAKSFKTPWGHEATVDFQVYNVFDWVNRNYTTWGSGNGINPPLKNDNDGTVGRARSFQAGLKYSF